MVSELTRRDEGGSFDSIKWAFETHLKRTDDPAFKFAVLYGNEDAPNSIDFWYSDHPDSGDKPDYRWHAEHYEIILSLTTINYRVLDDLLRLTLGLKGILDPEKVQFRYEVKRSEILDHMLDKEEDPNDEPGF